MKKFVLTIALLILSGGIAQAAGPTSVTYTIDPVKNANEHNNLGINYTEEKCYYAAIQEFKIAISLNPNTQATAVYYNNLGKVYMTIGYPDLALDCFQNAIIQYGLNFDYYKNYTDCCSKLGLTGKKLTQYTNDNSTPLNKIMTGLLYEKLGNRRKAIIVLDEFAMSEPDLLITPAVKEHIREIIDSMQ